MCPTERSIEPLRDYLERLETAVDTPAMPGEMQVWAAMVRKTFEETAREYLHQLDAVHPSQLKDIESQDPELLARVRGLREEDRRNREECQSLTKAFAEFEAHAIRAGADEKQVLEEQQRLLAAALHFVVQARKQETAIRAWSQEAYEREPGFGD